MAAQIPLDYRALAERHGGTSVKARKADVSLSAKKYGAITIPHESKDAVLPASVLRIAHAIQPEFVQGKPYKDAVATVNDHEPHKIEINDKERFNQGPLQTKAHELLHLWQNQLPGGLQNKVLPDDPNHPYSLDKIDEWRKQGYTLATIPREASATIVQRYVASPADRPRLQKWMDDLITTPLSVMEPTGPQDKGINTHARPPLPPVESFDISKLVEEAKRRAPRR